MKVICDRGVLVEALNLAGGVAAGRTTKPVLHCVKLAASAGSLNLAATDLDVGLSLTINQVDLQTEGTVLVPADKFASIVRESVDPTITIEAEGETTLITGNDSRFKIFGQPVGEFPPVDSFRGEPDFAVTAGQIVDLINKTIFATARETSRYAINGVLLERDNKKLTMVATDGRRLALARGLCSEAAAGAGSAIVPTKTLNLLIKLLDDPSETVRVKLADSMIHFATESATLSSKLVEGNFPPYKDVIPKDQDKRATFATDVLASAVRRASLLTSEESKSVRFSFSPESLQLSTRAPEMGEAEINVPVESYSGDAVDIGFNPFFVTDVLKVVDQSQIVFEMKAANKPGTLKAGQDFLYVVMPVSLT
jgi:DNA polymerase-3 subunit beta